LALLGVWLLFTDRLISRGSHLREIAGKDEMISHLTKTLEVRDQQVAVRDDQMQKLLANSDLTVQLLQSVAREARRGDLAS